MNKITYFVGENGTGKSALFEVIAVAYGFDREDGTLNYNFSTYLIFYMGIDVSVKSNLGVLQVSFIP